MSAEDLRPARIVLSRDGITLTPLEDAHAERLYDACSGKELEWTEQYEPLDILWRFTCEFIPTSVESFRDGFMRSMLSDPCRLPFAIVDEKHDARLIGCISFMTHRPAHRSVEIGSIWLAPAYMGTRFLPTCMLMLMEHAFANNYRRVEWTCGALNSRSARAAERLGFTYELTFKEHGFLRDRMRDTKCFSILDSEWPEIHEKLIKLVESLPSESHRSVPRPPPNEMPPLASAEMLEVARTLTTTSCVKELRGKFIRLEPLDKDKHGEGLFKAGNGSAQYGYTEYNPNELVWKYLFHSAPQTLEGMINIIDYLQKNSQPYCIVECEHQQPIGVATVCNNVPRCLRAELGHIWITPAYQGSSVIPEMVLLLVKCLQDLKYRRVEWKCDANNVRSRKVAARMGFTFEGVFRQHMLIKGLNRDTAWFAMPGEQEIDKGVSILESIVASRGKPIPKTA